jgi:LacI family transcriptional regulator
MDNRSIGQLCARYLLDLGYRSFGVYGLATEQFFEERCNSFISVVSQEGFSCQSLQQTGDREKPEQWERQQKSLVNWLRELPKPTAIMACTDQLGFWLLDACGRARISVPDEIAVIGVENDETLCAMSSPPLTSVSLGGERVGYEAAALLDRMMKGRKTPRKPTLFEAQGIVVRRSTDIVAISDPLLSQALRMIRDRASSGLRVADILREVPISRSSLERGLRATIGRSPNEEINRVRLEHARQLLIETKLTLEQVAARTGYAQAHYFSHCFSKAYSVTPGKFRKTRLAD